ncbi:hypothetical protein DYY65_07530 [Nitrososphaera sp. AFS]|nr:hypothetical protein [Nitrososphaera sp. AFS]
MPQLLQNRLILNLIAPLVNGTEFQVSQTCLNEIHWLPPGNVDKSSDFPLNFLLRHSDGNIEIYKTNLLQ